MQVGPNAPKPAERPECQSGHVGIVIPEHAAAQRRQIDGQSDCENECSLHPRCGAPRRGDGRPIHQLNLAKGARRWDAPETGNFTNLTALEASLDLILRIGVEAIAKYNLGLTTELIERLPYDRVALVSPADAEKRGPYVCIVARKPDETPKLFRRLASTEIVAAMRENAIRISPNIYNTSDHITRVIKSLSL